jgi:hypothetical protein
VATFGSLIQRARIIIGEKRKLTCDAQKADPSGTARVCHKGFPCQVVECE